MEKAQVEGLKLEDKQAEVEKEEALDEVWKIVDIQLSQEIGDQLRGIFDPVGIYNFPKRSTGGSLSMPECDLIKCPYKGKDPHIHIIGVGIQGALRAMRAYGRLRIHADEPDIKPKGETQYWVAQVSGVDRHNQNEINRYFFQPVKRKVGNTFVDDDQAPHIAQSKCMRNVILALIPGDLVSKWVEDYKAGKKPFDPKHVKEFVTEEKPAPLAEKPKNGTQPPPAADLESENLFGEDENGIPSEFGEQRDEWLKHIKEITNIKHLVNWGTKNKYDIEVSPYYQDIVIAYKARLKELKP